MTRIVRILVAVCILFGAGCAGGPPPADSGSGEAATGDEVALFALSLINTRYRFGGKNPRAGFDCSGMVTYIYARAADYELKGSAADMAKLGRRVALEEARPGDLVFFNTRNRPRSHVGIYIGDDRFVHAPGTDGRVKVSSLRNKYFAKRFEEVRRYLD